MSRQMLIDAAHPEETRVVVLDGGRLEEFDFESAQRKQLRGNIYLAKVTRVEPSLQAAFIDYGGNRHGFLAFNEIHPDYYQIPHADREALMREAQAGGDADEEGHTPLIPAPSGEEEADSAAAADEEDEIDETIARQRRQLMRRYKIQEVIKRRQIMLVQVVKEERGGKGAALTTYLSLAGRYCVLMPNTDRGGGISRKITAAADRKRLREVVAELDVPGGMGLIVRTAGAKRTRAEIRRDYEYLSRAWENIRDTTLRSIAPTLIYEEEDLVKRSIRDLFDKDVEAIWVEGEAGFREARDFMRMLIPSQTKKVQAWREIAPLFMARKVEDHLTQIYSSTVPLKSGGYLVINQTEALVAIDVNSGRATRERNIEATALRTNLEAAEEAARQLRLRDLAGLIVIDFIDMDEAKNNRAVEKVLKDSLARDRARIQMGRISPFGLMEISRQRRRTGILEGTTNVCVHCHGAGRIRTVESSALVALRAAQMEAAGGGGEIRLTVPEEVGLYILNRKRDHLLRMAQGQGVLVVVGFDETLEHADHRIERLSDTPYAASPAIEPRAGTSESAIQGREPRDTAPQEIDEAAGQEVDDEADPQIAEEADPALDALAETQNPASRTEHEAGRRRRRRRRGRGEDGTRAEPPAPPLAVSPPAGAEPLVVQGAADGQGAGGRRRRGRRGGRAGGEEARAGEVYAWSWPARLSGEDAYEWRGPGLSDPPLDVDGAGPASVISSGSADDTVMNSPVVKGVGDQPAIEVEPPEIWVELPAAADKPPRRGRSRRRREDVAANGGDTLHPTGLLPPGSGEAVGTPGPEALSAGLIGATALETSLAANGSPADSEVAELNGAGLAAAEVQATIEPPSADPPSPGPKEVSEPPAAPRRGWWRRGG